jgi:hypothetical protein
VVQPPTANILAGIGAMTFPNSVRERLTDALVLSPIFLERSAYFVRADIQSIGGNEEVASLPCVHRRNESLIPCPDIFSRRSGELQHEHGLTTDRDFPNAFDFLPWHHLREHALIHYPGRIDSQDLPVIPDASQVHKSYRSEKHDRYVTDKNALWIHLRGQPITQEYGEE